MTYAVGREAGASLSCKGGMEGSIASERTDTLDVNAMEQAQQPFGD